MDEWGEKCEAILRKYNNKNLQCIYRAKQIDERGIN